MLVDQVQVNPGQECVVSGEPTVQRFGQRRDFRPQPALAIGQAAGSRFAGNQRPSIARAGHPGDVRGDRGQLDPGVLEELLEISHHSLIQYRLPITGEIEPLLQIVPSKTDEERLLVVSPELADVLSTVIRRIREPGGALPLVPVYDRYECVWRPPSPVLFQRRFPSEIRAISDSSLRDMLNAALAHTGLKDPADGQPLHYTPHDFRRIFITDAVMSGLPPHIAQVIAGHQDINTTLGYKAVYPDEAIQAHLAFLARRRVRRPSDEYRSPPTRNGTNSSATSSGKVATGTCGRAFGSACIHEHALLTELKRKSPHVNGEVAVSGVTVTARDRRW